MTTDRNEYLRVWRDANRESVRASQRAYTARNLERERARKREYMRRQRASAEPRLYRVALTDEQRLDRKHEALRTYRAAHPEKTAAHRAVERALKRGRLVRRPCRDCGALYVHAHHLLGYDREHWLDVEWLCPTHHKAAHRNEDA